MYGLYPHAAISANFYKSHLLSYGNVFDIFLFLQEMNPRISATVPNW